MGNKRSDICPFENGAHRNKKTDVFLKNEDHTCFSENRINISTLSGNQHFLHRYIYILFIVIFSTVHLRQDRLTSTLLP